MRKIALAMLSVAMLSGCASGPSTYQLYAETQKAIAQAHAVSETARYNALLEIAKNGDSAAKVAAVLSIQMSGGSSGGQQRPTQQIAPPEDTSDKLLKWAGVLLPSVTQSLGIAANIYAANTQKQIAITQSNNAAATAASTNNAFTAMSNSMANSNTNIARAGFDALGAANTAITNIANSGMTAVTNVSNSGITGVTNVATTGLTAATNISNSANTSMTSISKSGMDGVVLVSKDSNATMNALGTQYGTNIQTVTNGFRTSLDNAISKLTGSTITTTTTTANTNNTTNNITCPTGQVLVSGLCK